MSLILLLKDTCPVKSFDDCLMTKMHSIDKIYWNQAKKIIQDSKWNSS